MDFEWDEEKNERAIQERGISFADAAAIFDGRPRIEASADRGDEARWITTAERAGKHWTVVYTLRGETIRIISVRRARKNEREAYRKAFP